MSAWTTLRPRGSGPDRDVQVTIEPQPPPPPSRAKITWRFCGPRLTLGKESSNALTRANIEQRDFLPKGPLRGHGDERARRPSDDSLNENGRVLREVLQGRNGGKA